MSSWTLYWLTRLDVLKVTFGGIILASSIIGFAALFGYTCCIAGGRETPVGLTTICKRTFYTCLFLLGFSIIGNVFAPSFKEQAFIYLAPKIVNNEQVKKIPENALKILNTKMEQYLDEIVSKNVTVRGQ